MEQRKFLAVFQNDGSLDISELDVSTSPRKVFSSFTYHIHSKKALVGVDVIRNGISGDFPTEAHFPSSAQLKQIKDAIIAILQIDEL